MNMGNFLTRNDTDFIHEDSSKEFIHHGFDKVLDKDNLFQKQFLEDLVTKLNAFRRNPDCFNDKEVKIDQVKKKTLIEEKQQTNPIFLLIRFDYFHKDKIIQPRPQTMLLEGIYKILSNEFNYALCIFEDGNELTTTIVPLDEKKFLFYRLQYQEH